jgi:hypothetical protein
MTSINEKLGLKKAGKRSMMKLPKLRAEACALTAAQCPECGQRGVVAYASRGEQRRMCSWCGRSWAVG